MELFESPQHAALAAVKDPEIDLARLEAALALGSAASDDSGRAKWQKLAAALRSGSMRITAGPSRGEPINWCSPCCRRMRWAETSN